MIILWKLNVQVKNLIIKTTITYYNDGNKIYNAFNQSLVHRNALCFGKSFSQTNNGAVGINTTTPNANSVLDVVSGNNNKGVLIPRLTEAQRNAIVINQSNDDGLTIYNTTEDCFNYWSRADNEWKSVCGQMGKAVLP